MKKYIYWGIGIGLLFGILAYANIGFYIGQPLSLLSQENIGRFLVVVVIAGIMEEIFFRFMLFGYLYNNVKPFKDRWALTNVTQALVFSFFHVTVYGSLIAKNALFVSAMVFGLAMGWLAYEVNQRGRWYPNQIPNILAHSITNFLIISGSLVIGLPLVLGG